MAPALRGYSVLHRRLIGEYGLQCREGFTELRDECGEDGAELWATLLCQHLMRDQSGA